MKVEDPFYHALMIREELGLTNFVFENVTASKEETKSCAYFPTLVFVIIVIVTLEMIRLTILIIMETRKMNKKIFNNTSLRNLHNNIHKNPGFINFAHQPQPDELVLNPDDLERDSAAHTSNIIYVNPAPEEGLGAALTIGPNGSSEESACIVYASAPTSDTNGAAIENFAATTSGSGINAASVEETPVLRKETHISTEKIRDTSLSRTIKNTLKLILFRSGTFSLIGFIMCIVILVPINVYINDKDLPFFPQLLISVARYFAFFLPLAWISFDRDIRVHSLLKLRNMWQRHFI